MARKAERRSWRHRRRTASGGRAARRSPAPNGGATPEDLRLALRAATLYYLDGLTQAEIAGQARRVPADGGPADRRAKAKGLVRIEVVVPPTMKDDLHADEERVLEQRLRPRPRPSVRRAPAAARRPARAC